MADMNPDTRVHQAPGVYTTPDNQQVHHILHDGQGAPDGPGHGHTIYNIPQDQIIYDRPPASS